jgi:P27 family predicted phage terminase small subunit
VPGPQPKPTSLKVLQGNPGHQKLSKREPKPRPLTPDPPEYLGMVGRRRWDELLPELEYRGTLTAVDGDALGQYCHGYERLIDAEKHLAEQGHVVERATGAPMLSPWAQERNRAWDDMAKAAAQLGIGAANRTRIEVKQREHEAEDPTAKAIAAAARRK